MKTKPRARDLCLHFDGRPGPNNAITDVAGLSVGFTTVIEDAAPGWHKGLCTGVTAIVPRGVSGKIEPVWAGIHSFNGNGELTGLDAFYVATVQATEEAVVNAMIAAEDGIAVKPEGKRVRAIEHARLIEVINEKGRSQ
jgi:L-aminopeptidase/D-esterase-like protein